MLSRYSSNFIIQDLEYWFPRWALVLKNLPVNAGDVRDAGLIPESGRSPGGGQPALMFLPGKSHRQRSLASYGP